jgi:hypothetical protein
MNLTAPLLAAINVDVIETLVILVIAGIAGIARVLAAMQQKQPPAGGPRVQQPPRPIPKDAADEIDDFLRRAAQQRTSQPTPQRTAQPAGQRTAQAPQPARLPAARAAASKPVVAEVVAAAPVGGQVTEHVQKFLDTEEFTRRGDQLGEEVVAQVDREIDQHLHQVFDHSLSQIAATPGETAAPPEAVGVMELPESSATEIPSTFATDLAALLTDSNSIRHAIVLNEIIHRPEERW